MSFNECDAFYSQREEKYKMNINTSLYFVKNIFTAHTSVEIT